MIRVPRLPRFRLRHCTFCLAVVLVLLDPPCSPAQTLPFERLSVRDGLRSNYITCMTQDGTRRLWIGTPDGLSMFDGSVFTTVGKDGTLPRGTVVAVKPDPQRGEVLWAATHGGVARIVHGRIDATWQVAPGHWLTDLVVARDGVVYAAAATAIFRVRASGLETLTLPGIAAGALRLCADGDGGFWILNVHGLHHHAPRSGRTRTIDRSHIRYQEANHLQCDEDGTLYVCGRDSTILVLAGDRVKRVIRWPAQPLCITIDDHGSFWVGTTAGVYVCRGPDPDPTTALHYTSESGLPATSVNVSFQDSERNLWFGTEGRGIARLEDQHIVVFRGVDITGRGMFDAHGHLWLTSTVGIWEYWSHARSQWARRLHRFEASWPQGYAYEIVPDGEGGCMVSFSSGAIAQFRITQTSAASVLTMRRIVAPARGIPAPDSFTMLVDRKGRLWCNGGGGHVMVVALKGVPRIERVFDGAPVDIRAMYEDSRGRVWIGGYAGDAITVDAGRLEHAVPHHVPGSDSLRIRAFHEDARGRMWIGTLDRGVVIIDGDTAGSFTTRDGLLEDKVFSFARAADGTMWIGTQTGVCRATTEGKPFRSHQELTDSPVYDCGLREDGVLFVATRYALVLYDVPMSSRDTTAPHLVLTRMQAGGREIDLRDVIEKERDIVLGAGENSCRIEYAAIHMRRPREIRYQYLLAGVDSAWSEPTRERMLILAALKPGTYTVLLRAWNSEHVVNASLLRVHFTVERPFWMQWWAVLLAALAIGGVVAVLVRARVRRLLEIERIRARIAADLHDDIGSGLTRIAMLAEVMERQFFLLRRQGAAPAADFPAGESTLGDIAAMLHRIGETSRELVEAMSDVVWSIDPRHDTFAQLFQRIRVFANDLCESRDMRFHVEMDAALGTQLTGSDFSRTVLLVCKEAINNAVRHSGAQHVRLEIALTGARLVLVVSDNGRGFDSTAQGRRSGLANMHMRVEKAGGDLRIDSTPERGTVLTASLPLR